MAADWSMLVLDPTQIAAGELEKIRADFARFFLSHDPGSSLAVFTRRTKTGGCEIYFSPGCEVYAEFLFERLPAQQTRAPALLGTTLLVGYPAAVSALLGKASTVESLATHSRQTEFAESVAQRANFLRQKSAG